MTLNENTRRKSPSDLLLPWGRISRATSSARDQGAGLPRCQSRPTIHVMTRSRDRAYTILELKKKKERKRHKCRRIHLLPLNKKHFS